MFDLLELIEFLPDILEIGSATKRYRESEANARLRLEAFAYGVLAQQARLVARHTEAVPDRTR